MTHLFKEALCFQMFQDGTYCMGILDMLGVVSVMTVSLKVDIFHFVCFCMLLKCCMSMLNRNKIPAVSIFLHSPFLLL